MNIQNQAQAQAITHAKTAHTSLFDSLVLRVLAGDELARTGLKHLITMSALEINEKRGNCH